MAQVGLSRAWQQGTAFSTTFSRRGRIRTIPRPGGFPQTALPRRSAGFGGIQATTGITNRFRCLSSTLSSWNEGDAVLVDIYKDQSKLVSGFIAKVGKAGWYTIRMEGSQEFQKVRKSQLLPVENPTTASNEVETVLDLHSIPDDFPVQEAVQAMPALTLDVDTPARYPVDPQAPPPPPRMDNLDALLSETEQDGMNSTHKEYLQQLQHHVSVRHWVVFTDLHCAPSTLDTTLQVLHRVHRLARDRKAGVLFLGDFWHHRGTLRVDCLNAVLNEFRRWTVPLILIPGNHDQVTLGGHSHGLTPLEHAFRVPVFRDDDTASVPGPLVLSHPTLLAGALFVPHIRDVATMEAILQTKMAREMAQAIFVHADVTGAYMNDRIVSTEGVHPSAFPPNKPIYSGHFHKPHTVTSKKHQVAIEYLGSPYQVSLAEAEQEKALVVLDASRGWKCAERIPLSIGRRHYKPHSVADLMALSSGAAAAATFGRHNPTTTVQSGDRIVVTLSSRDLLELPGEVEDHIRQLRTVGVAVEMRENTDPNNGAVPAVEESAVGVPNLEDLSPTSTWERFWEDQVQRGAIEPEAATELKQAGLALLVNMDQEKATSGVRDSSLSSRTGTILEFDSVIVEGYGPFPNRVVYPLNNRGLVLLRGSNLDGGSDSNGSGKTSLAMAALWALTGSADPRPFQDNSVADVVNDSNKNARVTLTGRINEKPYSITRTKSSKKSGLVFILDGHDMTTQSVKETMAVIEENLGLSAPVLARTMFHGQHALNDLLEATDAKLKEELSLIVPLDLWQGAASVARSNGKMAAKKQNELEGMSSLREDDLEKLKVRCLNAAVALSAKEHALEAKEADLAARRNRQIADFQQQQEAAIPVLTESIGEATAHFETSKRQLQNILRVRDFELNSLTTSLSERMQSAREAAEHHQHIHFEYQSFSQQVQALQSRISSLEVRWKVNLSSGEVPMGFVIPDSCPTCLQSLSKEMSRLSVAHDNRNHLGAHNHVNLQVKAEVEIKEALDEVAAAHARLSSTTSKLHSAKGQRQACDERVLTVEQELKGRRSYWEERVSHAEKEVTLCQEQIAKLTASLAANADLLQQATLLESRQESEVKAAQDALGFAKETYDNLKAELDGMATDIEQLRGQLKDQKSQFKLMSSLSEALGNRGVQTFVLQNAVKDLQLLTQRYLDDFSDGAQRLELSLDAGDKISRQALVRDVDGSFRERPLATLSGGQWRRCSLALTLGFADLVATRGGLRPSLIVLDEPLTHLDRAGRRDVGKVLRKILVQSSASTSQGHSNLSVSTIIVILQDLAAEELEEAFDRIDEVVKQDGVSIVNVDEHS